MQKKLITFFVLLLPYKLLHAGAVVRIDRVDLASGKKIIFFSEYHIGPITPMLNAHDLASRQYRILHQLFETFILHRNNYALYLEHIDALKELHRAYHISTRTMTLQGFASSWFDRIYLGYIFGEQWPYFEYARNFDQRTKADWLLNELAHFFDGFYQDYRNSGFNEERFNVIKNRFFALESYQQLRQEMANDYDQLFLTRLSKITQRLEQRLIPADFARLQTMIDQRMSNYPVFVNALQKATFLNKPFIEFLFDMAHLFKADFYPSLSALLAPDIPLTTIFQLTSFSGVLADLGILEVILNDPHPVLLISCGARHARFVMDFLLRSPMARSLTYLDMLDPVMIEDLDVAVATTIQFVNQ